MLVKNNSKKIFNLIEDLWNFNNNGSHRKQRLCKLWILSRSTFRLQDTHTHTHRLRTLRTQSIELIGWCSERARTNFFFSFLFCKSFTISSQKVNFAWWKWHLRSDLKGTNKQEKWQEKRAPTWDLRPTPNQNKLKVSPAETLAATPAHSSSLLSSLHAYAFSSPVRRYSNAFPFFYTIIIIELITQFVQNVA